MLKRTEAPVRHLKRERLSEVKPLHIVILVAAGAMAGAVIMKVASQPRTAAVPVVAQVQPPPATAPATPPATATPPAVPADAQVTGVPANPSPFEAPKPLREVPKPRRAQRTAVVQPPAVEAPPRHADAPAATPSHAEPE